MQPHPVTVAMAMQPIPWRMLKILTGVRDMMVCALHDQRVQKVVGGHAPVAVDDVPLEGPDLVNDTLECKGGDPYSY